MNVLYWGEMDGEAMQEEQGFEPEEERRSADPERVEPRLQTVAESVRKRSPEEQALIDQWLVERQCSGL